MLSITALHAEDRFVSLSNGEEILVFTESMNAQYKVFTQYNIFISARLICQADNFYMLEVNYKEGSLDLKDVFYLNNQETFDFRTRIDSAISAYNKSHAPQIKEADSKPLSFWKKFLNLFKSKKLKE